MKPYDETYYAKGEQAGMDGWAEVAYGGMTLYEHFSFLCGLRDYAQDQLASIEGEFKRPDRKRENSDP